MAFERTEKGTLFNREGLEAQADILAKAFLRKSVELDTLLKVAIEEGCIIVEGQAVTLAPVDTGLLRKSINHRVIDRKGYPVGQIGTNVEYAPFQEFGTTKMKPQPFLLPALNQKRAQVKEVIARRLKTAL